MFPQKCNFWDLRKKNFSNGKHFHLVLSSCLVRGMVGRFPREDLGPKAVYPASLCRVGHLWPFSHSLGHLYVRPDSDWCFTTERTLSPDSHRSRGRPLYGSSVTRASWIRRGCLSRSDVSGLTWPSWMRLVLWYRLNFKQSASFDWWGGSWESSSMPLLVGTHVR